MTEQSEIVMTKCVARIHQLSWIEKSYDCVLFRCLRRSDPFFNEICAARPKLSVFHTIQVFVDLAVFGDDDAGLFAHLAHQSLLGRFSGIDLAARKAKVVVVRLPRNGHDLLADRH